VLRPGGYSTITDPDAPRAVELDTLQCGHCARHIHVKPGSASTIYLFPQANGQVLEEAGAMCRVCMRPVCLTCHDTNHGQCEVWEKKIERMEAVGVQRRKLTEAMLS
jgi:hypothetical protein